MSADLHIYTRRHQPATRFVDTNMPGDLARRQHRCSARRQIYATCCGKRRWAKNLTVQVYYDAITFWCRKDRGCKRRPR